MTQYRTISITPSREKLYKELKAVTPEGTNFSQMLGECVQVFLKEERNMATKPSIENFEEWQEYAHDCDKEDFDKLINFTTRLVNTVRRNESLIRK